MWQSAGVSDEWDDDVRGSGEGGEDEETASLPWLCRLSEREMGCKVGGGIAGVGVGVGGGMVSAGNVIVECRMAQVWCCLSLAVEGAVGWVERGRRGEK